MRRPWVEDNVLTIANGGQVFISGAAAIAKIESYSGVDKTNLNNRIVVTGAGSLLHLASNSLDIAPCENDATWVAVGNALRVANGGKAAAISTLTVGCANNATTTNNCVELAGGTVECTNLYVRAGNVIAADVAAYGAEDTPMTVAGTAELANGSLVRPLPFAVTPNSDWHVILRAQTLRDQGVALDPAYAECYRLDVDTAAGTISLRYLPPSTVVLVR